MLPAIGRGALLHPVVVVLYSGLGRAALRLVAGLVVAVILAAALTVASLLALVDALLPPGGAPVPRQETASQQRSAGDAQDRAKGRPAGSMSSG